ncbi:ubiquitin-specific protease [Reticulomyxa filosa]|uniref:Ubiquitin-specific protease n=1 Tax=Reticulomyxa filosa TaxID=46433 RepID=X6MC82_RETFI|nr:ubiquitin-specific protease [Reticulomyxa filosa]|eukprot:ETO11628.1 ubiquitin-specific protease [Reticulomyxa filosa]
MPSTTTTTTTTTATSITPAVASRITRRTQRAKTRQEIELLNPTKTLQTANIRTNGYLYLEAVELSGQWTGVQGLHSTLESPRSANGDEEKEEEEEEEEEEHDDNDDEINSKVRSTTKYQDLTSKSSSVSITDDTNQHSLSFGVVGLRNMGNTCYLNAALQCLSHTMPLTEYFLSKIFINELNKNKKFDDDPDHWRVPLAVGALLCQMWLSEPFSTHIPRSVKSTVALVNSLLEGHEQHDSQEALQALLSGIHEGLNRVKVICSELCVYTCFLYLSLYIRAVAIEPMHAHAYYQKKKKNKAYVQIEDSNERSDEVVAKEHWECHLKREQSIIVNLFEGQYKNTLKCIECGRVNNKFETYQMLSLPIPEITDIFVKVIVHYYHPCRKPIRYSVRFAHGASVRNVIRHISQFTNIPSHLLVPTHVISNTIRSFFSLDESVQNLQSQGVFVLYGVYNAPTGIRPGEHFDVRDHYLSWYEAEVLEIKPFEDLFNRFVDTHPEEARKYSYSRLQPADNILKRAQSMNLPLNGDRDDEIRTLGIPSNLLSTKSYGDFLTPVLGPLGSLLSGSTALEEQPSLIGMNVGTERSSSPRDKDTVVTVDDLRGKWMVRVHYLNWSSQWDEWIPHDSSRIQPLGSKVKSSQKPKPTQISMPYHVLPLRCVHRRIIPVAIFFF